MKVKALSVKDAITRISRNQIFLPPIQRSFVWDRDRIVRLFDSLYRDYPLGNCIFWNVNPDTQKHYPLYQFVRSHTEGKRDNSSEEQAATRLFDDNVFAVIDGQQRLSSLFIGLEGTYKYKKRGKGLRNVTANQVEARLYLNLFSPEVTDQDEPIFQFLPLAQEKALTDKSLWFDIRTALLWKNPSDAGQYVDVTLAKRVAELSKKAITAQFENKRTVIKSRLDTLWRMLNEDRIFYFDVTSQNLDEVVDMFTRINSGGMILKKSDLLFSVLVSQWSEGRNELRGLVESMRSSGLSVTQDFMMRSCLMLTDTPVKYNLGAFKAGTVKKIRDNWDDIKSSMMSLCTLLPQIGYKDLPGLSENALIPIAYYIMKKGSTSTLAARKTLQRYYVVSQVKGIFGGQSDQILERFRSEISRQLKKTKTLDFQGLIDMRLPGERSMSLNEKRLDELIDDTLYGSSHAYFLLALVYPTVDFISQRYEVDHIHPRSKFNPHNLKNNGITDPDQIENWTEWKRDALPNLELLGGNNQRKGATPIVDYIQNMDSKEDREDFCRTNLLPSPGHKDLELRNFDAFYESRKRKLISKLKPHFGL